MRFLKHPLFLSILVMAVLYTVFAHVLEPAVPVSLLAQYMVVIAVAILLVVTFDDDTAKTFFAPILALLGSKKLKGLRALAFFGVVAGAGYITYGFVKPSIVSPIELRTVHPAPPSTLRVYGKSYDLQSLQNPFRELEADPEAYTEVLAEGAELYYKNCIFCHGDMLDGTGVFANAFTPRPINFQDVGMIAQLQESFLFWRITTGGPGLPREGTPWASAMPVWEEILSEDEVWKIISFLYDYTGYEPRSWELEESTGEDVVEAAATEVLDEDAVNAIYQKRCSQCHGEEGDGLGVAAEFMYPAPRDFTLGLFKFKTTDADSEFPTDADLRNTIRDGLPGTAMPAWKSILTDAEIDALIEQIKVFGYWDGESAEDLGLNPIALGTPPAVTPELLAQGRVQFVKACVQCHGEEGRGNITSGKKLADDAEDRIWPRNLTQPETWRVTMDVEDVFQRLSTGIPGTPMPEHATTMSEADRWAIANYVMTLREGSVPLAEGESVIKAVRVEGDLPVDNDDPAWALAPAITFAMAPNVIKEPRLFTSLNPMVTIRALYNDSDIAMRVDVDDRTYSVPGSELEQAYAIEGVEGTQDAIAIQLPAMLSGTNEKPWFRHGDSRNPVNMWYWAAPSEAADMPEMAMLLDADGPDAAPTPRADSVALAAGGEWKDGRWRIVFRRALETTDAADLQFQEGVYTPIAFANWDGVNGEAGARHSFTSWYWLLLEPEDNPAKVYGFALAAAVVAGLIFLILVLWAREREYEVNKS